MRIHNLSQCLYSLNHSRNLFSNSLFLLFSPVSQQLAHVRWSANTSWMKEMSLTLLPLVGVRARGLSFERPAGHVHSPHLIQPVVIISILSMGRLMFRERRHDSAHPARDLGPELWIYVCFLYASCPRLFKRPEILIQVLEVAVVVLVFLGN